MIPLVLIVLFDIILMTGRREFIAAYQQAISLIKQVKLRNDQLNRAIGVDHESAIAQRLRAEHSLHEETTLKLDLLIGKLEQSYLDPDTARKIGTAKQQYRIQKDRRRQLLQSIQLEQKHISSTHRHHLPSHQQFQNQEILPHPKQPKKQSNGSHRQIDRQLNGNHRKEMKTESNSTKGSARSGGIELQNEQLGVDYDLQSKMMRERSKELNEVHQNLLYVQSMMSEASEMTYQQGRNLDIIEQEIFTTYKNTKQSRQQLVEANDHQRRARAKYVFLSLAVLIALAIVVAILLI